MKNLDNKKSLSRELIRFAVVGVIATIVDLIINYVFVFVLPNNLEGNLKTVLCTTFGFIGGVIFNYILSTIWVFQDVENEKEVKSTKNFILFVLLSAIGLVLGIEFMSGFNSIANTCFNVDLYSWQPSGISGIFSNLKEILLSLGFWLFTISFCIKTLLVLIYNYISRKKLIYKSKKED